MQHPGTLTTARGVKVHYLGTFHSSRPHDKCASAVRGIQNHHMDSNGWSDIAYNYLVCEHGYAFEGRGAGTRSAANGNTALNAGHYAVCALLGSSGLTRPSPEMLHGLRDAIEYLRARGAGSEIRGHRDGYATACPGQSLYDWVQRGAPRPGSEKPTGKPTAPAGGGGAYSPPAFPAGIAPNRTRPSARGLQRALKAAGYMSSDLPEVDNYGPRTQDAVAQFHWVNPIYRSRGATRDAAIGPKGWAHLHRLAYG